MVFIWSSGGRRRRGGPGWGRGYGPPPGYGRGYGRGYGGGYGRGYGRPPGYGYRRRDDGSCLRDLLFLNTGCCLANAIGCGMEMAYLAPTTARHVHRAGTGPRGTRLADKLVAAVRVYQREVSRWARTGSTAPAGAPG